MHNIDRGCELNQVGNIGLMNNANVRTRKRVMKPFQANDQNKKIYVYLLEWEVEVIIKKRMSTCSSFCTQHACQSQISKISCYQSNIYRTFRCRVSVLRQGRRKKLPSLKSNISFMPCSFIPRHFMKKKGTCYYFQQKTRDFEIIMLNFYVFILQLFGLYISLNNL